MPDMALSAFEKQICNHLTGYTGRRIMAKDLLVWSIDKNWLEKHQMPDEDMIFLKSLEIWCLVRQKTKGSPKCALN